MERDILRLHQMLQSGACCAQAMVAMGLELNGWTNPQMETAAAALCMGVRSGLTCGALSGAAMMMSLFDPEAAADEMIPELSEWFQDTYGELYGGSNCVEILEGDRANKVMRCPALIENTYRKAREILEDCGFDMDELLRNLKTGE